MHMLRDGSSRLRCFWGWLGTEKKGTHILEPWLSTYNVPSALHTLCYSIWKGEISVPFSQVQKPRLTGRSYLIRNRIVFWGEDDVCVLPMHVFRVSTAPPPPPEYPAWGAQLVLFG